MWPTLTLDVRLHTLLCVHSHAEKMNVWLVDILFLTNCNSAMAARDVRCKWPNLLPTHVMIQANMQKWSMYVKVRYPLTLYFIVVNEHDSVSNHRKIDCLFDQRLDNKISKPSLAITTSHSWILFLFARADSRSAPNQWETVVLYNDVSRWLGASLIAALPAPGGKMIGAHSHQNVKCKSASNKTGDRWNSVRRRSQVSLLRLGIPGVGVTTPISIILLIFPFFKNSK